MLTEEKKALIQKIFKHEFADIATAIYVHLATHALLGGWSTAPTDEPVYYGKGIGQILEEDEC